MPQSSQAVISFQEDCPIDDLNLLHSWNLAGQPLYHCSTAYLPSTELRTSQYLINTLWNFVLCQVSLQIRSFLHQQANQFVMRPQYLQATLLYSLLIFNQLGRSTHPGLWAQRERECQKEPCRGSKSGCSRRTWGNRVKERDFQRQDVILPSFQLLLAECVRIRSPRKLQLQRSSQFQESLDSLGKTSTKLENSHTKMPPRIRKLWSLSLPKRLGLLRFNS